MSNRLKDVLIGFIIFTLCFSAFSFLVDVILIDGLEVNSGFLGSLLGAIIGALVLGGTTYFIIESQRKENQKQIETQNKINTQQIEAQKEITIKQVEDADKRDRERIYLKYLLDEHDRLLKDFWDIEEQVSLFHDATLKYFYVRNLTSQISPSNPMYPKLIEIEIDMMGNITLRKQSIENKSLSLLSSATPIIGIDTSEFSELEKILKLHIETVDKISHENGLTYENLHKKIEQKLTPVKDIYIKVTYTIFSSKAATIIRIKK